MFAQWALQGFPSLPGIGGVLTAVRSEEERARGRQARFKESS